MENIREKKCHASRGRWTVGAEKRENSSNSSASTDYPKRMGRPGFGTNENVGRLCPKIARLSPHDLKATPIATRRSNHRKGVWFYILNPAGVTIDHMTASTAGLISQLTQRVSVKVIFAMYNFISVDAHTLSHALHKTHSDV